MHFNAEKPLFNLRQYDELAREAWTSTPLKLLRSCEDIVRDCIDFDERKMGRIAPEHWLERTKSHSTIGCIQNTNRSVGASAFWEGLADATPIQSDQQISLGR